MEAVTSHIGVSDVSWAVQRATSSCILHELIKRSDSGDDVPHVFPVSVPVLRDWTVHVVLEKGPQSCISIGRSLKRV